MGPYLKAEGCGFLSSSFIFRPGTKTLASALVPLNEREREEKRELI